MKLTRRELAGALAGAAAASRGQTSPSAFGADPQERVRKRMSDPVLQTEASADLLKSALEKTQHDSTAIAKFQVPAGAEPAFVFRAQ